MDKALSGASPVNRSRNVSQKPYKFSQTNLCKQKPVTLAFVISSKKLHWGRFLCYVTNTHVKYVPVDVIPWQFDVFFELKKCFWIVFIQLIKF